MKHNLAGIAIGLALIMILPSAALPCRCKEPSMQVAYKRADTVVVAKVISITTDPNTRMTVVLSVSQVWKRDSPEQVTITTGPPCGYNLEKDSEYLLYLLRAPNGIYTDICARNRKLEQAKEPIHWLQRYGKSAKITPA